MLPIDEEELLGRFRHWLRDAHQEATRLAAENGAAVETGSEVGLVRLVEEFTALRQEVKLQARSARGLEEESGRLLSGLQQALETLRSIAPKTQASGKGLALALIELDEALDRGLQQIDKAGRKLLELPEAALLQAIDDAVAGLPWWRRMAAGGLREQLRTDVSRQLKDSQRSVLVAALRDGYVLMQQRLARSLAAEGITRIPAQGRPVDPQAMVVLETVDAPGPPGVVVEEVRRGYLWNGALLRIAEVRASRLAPLETERN